MAAWCLPRDLSSAFLEKISDGTLSPDRLREMSSDERRAAFAEVVGDENAREVNAQFEAKLLLKDQQRGMVSWAQKVAGITEPTRRDMLASINRLDRVLQPDEERAFLADLAAKRLGVSVTAQEAREIFELSQRAEALRAQIAVEGEGDYRAGWTVQNGIAYGRAYQALAEKVNSLKPQPGALAKAAFGVYNLPREIQTSIFHWSAPFVQGWGMISTKQWWQGLGQMFQYFARKDAYADLQAYIIGHPDYEFARDGKLGLTNLGDKLTQGEEGLQTHLLSDANQWVTDRSGVPNLIKGWQQSFVGFLNYVRFNRFVDLLNAARAHGEDISLGSQNVKDLASVVNNFTGRGPLPGGVAASARDVGVLNAIFYAPRKITATIQMFNPVFYARLSPTARGAAMRQLVGSLAATGAVLTLAKIMGAQTDYDPRSANFAKIVMPGGEKLDMTGGNSTYLRLLARLASGQEITANGKLVSLEGDTPHGATRAEMVENFLRGKLAPVAAVIANGLYGKDPVGRAFNLPNELYQSMTPIVIHSMIDDYENNPNFWGTLLPSLSAFLGVGLESPLPPMSESGRDVWGDPMPPFGTPKSWTTDPVNQALSGIGYRPSFPEQKIRGQPLTPEQFDDYSRMSGRLAHMRLETLVESSMWNGLTTARKTSLVRTAVRQSREIAATSIMLQSQGGPHDILRAAYAAKAAAAGLPVQ